MSAPSKAYQYLPVKVRYRQRLATSLTPTFAFRGGNESNEARGREMSSRRVSEQIEPRNNHLFGSRYRSLGRRQQSYSRKGRGCKYPAGSEMTARHYRVLI